MFWIEGSWRRRWRSRPWKITGGRWVGLERVRGRVSSTVVWRKRRRVFKESKVWEPGINRKERVVWEW